MKMNMSKWICFAVGFVFITSGMMKLLFSDFKLAFTNLGIPFPIVILFIVAIIEITCGTLIIANMYIKQAAMFLMAIMVMAISLTKFPVLMKGELLPFLFEARLDIVMLILLYAIWRHMR